MSAKTQTSFFVSIVIKSFFSFVSVKTLAGCLFAATSCATQSESFNNARPINKQRRNIASLFFRVFAGGALFAKSGSLQP
jgi:hypothetical protein